MGVKHFAIFLSVLSVLRINAQTLDPEKQQQINEVIEAILDCSPEVMGLTLSTLQNGEAVFANGYGLQDHVTGKPVDANSLFAIASVSKHFTTTLLGMVLQENGLSWDTVVRDILGEEFFFYDGLRSSHVTLKDLVAHRSGQQRRDFIGFKTQDGNNRRDTAYDARFVAPPEPFRDTSLYNNHMFEMTAFITEFLSGENWEDLMTKKIFEPVGMTSTTFIHKLDLERDDIAKPYHPTSFNLTEVNNTVNAKIGRLGGAMSLVTNAEDMARWLKIQADEGRLDGIQIIPESVIRETQTSFNAWPSSPTFLKPRIPETYVTTGYGLGLQTGWYRGYRMITHSGYLYGYNTLMTILPDMDIGVFTSATGVDFGGKASILPHLFIMDVLLDEQPWLDTTTVCTFPELWSHQLSEEELVQEMIHSADGVVRPPMNVEIPERRQALPQDLNPYLGQYGDFFYGNLTIFADESQTRLFLRYGEVEPWELVTSGGPGFYGIAHRSVFPLDINRVIFSKSDEALEQFDIVQASFDSDLSTFVRDQKKSDSPPPPDPNNCS